MTHIDYVAIDRYARTLPWYRHGWFCGLSPEDQMRLAIHGEDEMDRIEDEETSGLKIRKSSKPKPIYPLKDEFIDSLAAYMIAAGDLADTVRTALHLESVTGRTAGILKERLEAFDHAQFGDMP